jgi:uncharacterized membrane protein YfcA
VFELEIFAFAAIVGALGGLLGIGGGVFIIPVLTLLFHVPIKVAIGASLVSVIATSTAAGAVHVGHGVAHVKLAMALEVATTLGALAGGLTAIVLRDRVLEGLFAAVLLVTAWRMRRLKPDTEQPGPTGHLDTFYREPPSGRVVRYGVRRLPAGVAASFVAGNVSGLLGIGGGIIKVPMMTLIMGVPLRAAVATSNFMIGVTAATGAVIYAGRGLLSPRIAVPTALGVLLGASLQPRLLSHLRGSAIKWIFSGVLALLGVQMLVKALWGIG